MTNLTTLIKHMLLALTGTVFIGALISLNPEIPRLLAYLVGWGVGIWSVMEATSE